MDKLHWSGSDDERASKQVLCSVSVLLLPVLFQHPACDQEALALKSMEPCLHDVLDSAIKVMNFVKVRVANTRLFAALCEEVGME